MKVLVTGSKGFIGKNFISTLREAKDDNEHFFDIITYDIDDDFSKIEDNIGDIGFIFHFAGVNRPKDVSEFYSGNIDLITQIINLLKCKNLNIPILITSSIQAAKDNDYGKSKKQAEEAVFGYESNDNVYVFRLHNVFGKWARPNYNSVVATFCHNISRGKEIIINDESAEIELVYIDDIVKEFIGLLKGEKPTCKEGNYYHITPKYTITVGELAQMLKNFKESMEGIWVPGTGDEFTKKMYSTYISYTPVENMVIPLVLHSDNRGSFSELVRTSISGQFSISYSKPGIIRGNHYHHTKLERFIVVKGQARISFTNIINDDDSFSFDVSDEKLEAVTIPPGYTHNIENTGDQEMMLLIWCNELFDEKKPDTYFMEVKQGL